MATLTTVPAPPVGLSDEQVRERIDRGDVNQTPRETSRTVAAILRENVMTRFNALLGALLAITLVIGPIQDAAFGAILIANTLIGIVQELRAKWTLDRLAVLSEPTVRVRRAGGTAEIPSAAVVLDDLVELRAGTQIPVDGVVLETSAMEVDESLLTGEAEPVDKRAGDEVLSGSFVVAGSGLVHATRVGASAYGRVLTSEARRFSLVHSELRSGINVFLRLIGWAMIPIGAVLIWGQLRANGQPIEVIRSSLTGLVAMVPEGLVLLTSVAFAVGVVRLGRRRILTEQLAAVETLARVDIVCIDKTGTLTERTLQVDGIDELEPGAPVVAALGSLAAADLNPNVTMAALQRAHPPAPGWVPVDSVPVSSARRWSSVTFAGTGTWVLGAPEALAPAGAAAARVAAAVSARAAKGQRVLLLARSGSPPGAGGRPPEPLTPVAVVGLREEVRADAVPTIRYFLDEGVSVKVISGDNPATVAAVAGAAGVPGAERPLSGTALPADPEALGDAMEATSVFGRISPQQKRAMVGALRERGHVVAMTGDGVNDVLALKEADIGIAMGTGSDATRSVGELVLLDDSFAALPHAVAEGRRVIANIERVASLFLAKTVYAMLLALAVAGATLPFPLLNRQLSIIGAVAVGIPAFFLALAPNAHRARPGFVARVLRVAAPTGAAAAAATFTAYALALWQGGEELSQARTTATLVLAGVGLWLVTVLARPLNRWRVTLVGTMVAAVVATVVVPPLRRVLSMEPPSLLVLMAAAGVLALTVSVLELAWRVVDRLFGEHADAAGTEGPPNP